MHPRYWLQKLTQCTVADLGTQCTPGQNVSIFMMFSEKKSIGEIVCWCPLSGWRTRWNILDPPLQWTKNCGFTQLKCGWYREFPNICGTIFFSTCWVHTPPRGLAPSRSACVEMDSLIHKQHMFLRVPTDTGIPGKIRQLFPVREKSGNFEKMSKVREKSGNFN